MKTNKPQAYLKNTTDFSNLHRLVIPYLSVVKDFLIQY